MGLGHSPSIIVDGLIFHIDPNNPRCYSGSGNTIYNLVNPSIGGTYVGFTENPIDNTEIRSFAFDGTNDFIQTNYNTFFASDFTIEVYAKFTRYNDYQCILSSANNGGAGSGFWFEFGSGRGFTIFTTGSQLVLEDNVVSLTNLELNKWHHIVATRSGTGASNAKLYVNNILCGQNTSNAAIGHTSFAMMIGKYDYVGNYSYYKGNVGSVSLYNRGLSASEILQNYNAKRKKFYPEENIVSDGLIFNIDANKNLSYPGTGNTIYDISGSGQTGTFTNGPIFSGLNGGYISFDGTNDYIDYPRSSLYDFGSSDFTIMYWINTTVKDTYNAVIDLNDAGGKMIIGTYNNLSWMWFTSSYNIVGTINLCDGIWHQATISRIGSTLTHYVDGRVSVSTNVGATVVPSNNFFSIGRLVQTSSYGQIKLADVKLYKNRGLTQQEILQNFNASKGRFVNALVPVRDGLVLELDAANRASYSGTGNTWYDLSGNNLNGTLTNGPAFSGVGATSSLVFDRTNDHILIADNSLLNTFFGMTLEVIVRYTTTNDQIFVQKVNYSAGGGYTLELFSSGIAAFCYGSGGSSYLNVSVSNYPANNIYHMLFTLSGNTQTLYINGVSVATNVGGSFPSISGTVM